MHGQPEGRHELPMEVELRECCDAADRPQIQIVVQMPVDVIQHPMHPGMVVSKRRSHHPDLRGATSYAHMGMTCSTYLAVRLGLGAAPKSACVQVVSSGGWQRRIGR